MVLGAALLGCNFKNLMPRKKQSPPPRPAEVARLEITATTYCVQNRISSLGLKMYDAAGNEVTSDTKLATVTDPPDLAEGWAVKTPVRQSLELLGTPIRVKVTHPNGKASAEATLAPDYCDGKAVPWFSFGGDGGQHGRSGDNGGAPNAPGGPGSPGGAGSDAEPLHIEADTFVGPDKQKLLLIVFASANGELDRVVVHDPAKGPIRVGAAGGQGGSGGSGGTGGDCAGGGDGSHGGPGGRGAAVTLVLGNAALEELITVDVAGGSGGNFGSGGSGGLSSSNCNYGGAGPSGRSGQPGRPGQPGKLKVVVKKKPPLVQQALATCARCRTK